MVADKAIHAYLRDALKEFEKEESQHYKPHSIRLGLILHAWIFHSASQQAGCVNPGMLKAHSSRSDSIRW